MIIIISSSIGILLLTLIFFHFKNKNKKIKIDLNNFIQIYENALDPEFCDQVIKKFNIDGRRYEGVTGGGLNKNVKDTTDLAISRLKDWKDIDQIFFKSLNKHLEIYSGNITNLYKSCNINSKYRIGTQIEDAGYQIQRYIKKSGFYKWHQDSRTEEKRSRMLTYLWYLNDVEEGGETEMIGNIKIKPKKGQLLIFPACWMYMHRGCMPVSNDKYISTGWVYEKV